MKKLTKPQFITKQNQLLESVNSFLLSNPKFHTLIPPKSIIIPVDTKDPAYFKLSLDLYSQTIRQGKKNILLALLLQDGNWDFQKRIA